MIRVINCPHKRAWAWPHAGGRDDQTRMEFAEKEARKKNPFNVSSQMCFCPSLSCLQVFAYMHGVGKVELNLFLILILCVSCLQPLLKVHLPFPLWPWIKASFIQCPQAADWLWVLFSLLSVCEYFFRIEMRQWNRSGLCVSCSVY